LQLKKDVLFLFDIQARRSRMIVKQRAYVRPEVSSETRFCRPEALLLDCFRLWSQSPDNYTYLSGLIAREVGRPHAERSAKAIKLLAHVLGLHSRRTFYLMHPGSKGATADERALLALIGAVLHNHRTHANAIAMWLLPVTCHGTVLAVAGELGRAFRAGGLEIARPRHAAMQKKEPVQIRAVS